MTELYRYQGLSEAFFSYRDINYNYDKHYVLYINIYIMVPKWIHVFIMFPNFYNKEKK